MPCEAGGIGTNVPSLFKAKAGNLLHSLPYDTYDTFINNQILEVIE